MELLSLKKKIDQFYSNTVFIQILHLSILLNCINTEKVLTFQDVSNTISKFLFTVKHHCKLV